MEPTKKSNDERPRRNWVAVSGADMKRIASAMAADARMLYFS